MWIQMKTKKESIWKKRKDSSLHTIEWVDEVLKSQVLIVRVRTRTSREREESELEKSLFFWSFFECRETKRAAVH